jgi:hypothetical protein
MRSVAERWRTRLPVAVVIAACLAAWLPGVRGPYHFDDAITPLGDPASQSLGALGAHLAATIRPATKLTYAIEASLGLGDDAPARRIVSIVMLAIAAVLLFELLRALVPRLGAAGAAIGATIFAVHPVHAESVLAIAGRTAVLSEALVLAALLAWVRTRPRASAAFLLAAILARETALAAVLAIVALELAGQGTWREHARRLAPIAAAIAIAVAWLAFTPRYRALATYSLGTPSTMVSRVAQIGAVPIGLALYVRVDKLTIDHGEQLPAELADPRVLVGLAMFALAAAISIVAIRRRQIAVAVGSALWLAAILPTQSLIPKLDALTERPLALALAGLVLAVAPACVWLAARGRAARRVGTIAVMGIAVALAIATLARAPLYRSDLALWRDAAGKSDFRARPHYNYGIALEQHGLRDDALAEMQRADQLEPFDPDVTAALSRLRHHATSPAPPSAEDHPE